MTAPVCPAPPAGAQAIEAVEFTPAHPAGQRRKDVVISESPLNVQVDGATYTLLRTPGADRELVVGFLFTEGLIASTDDILMLQQCPESLDVITVQTSDDAKAKPRRSLIITSSCGLCGKDDINAMLASLDRVESQLRVSLATVFRIPAIVRTMQPLFQATGGAHASAFFDAAGNVPCVMEDVGRHNALDKLIGHTLLRGGALGDSGVFLSGRTSLEMIVKAARARIPVVAAVGAPTKVAIEAAERLGITLCGFLREKRISVYAHSWRLEASA